MTKQSKPMRLLICNSSFTRYVFPLILAWVTNGCTATRELGPPNAKRPDVRRELNDKAGGYAADVTLRSGERLRAKALRIEPEETTWIDPEGGAVLSVPTEHITQIRFRVKAPGIGTALGAVWGLATVASADMLKRLFFDLPCEMTMGLAGVLGESEEELADQCPSGIGAAPYLIAGVVGALYGNLAYRRRIVFSVDEPVRPELDKSVEPVALRGARFPIGTEDREYRTRGLLIRVR